MLREQTTPNSTRIISCSHYLSTESCQSPRKRDKGNPREPLSTSNYMLLPRCATHCFPLRSHWQEPIIQTQTTSFTQSCNNSSLAAGSVLLLCAQKEAEMEMLGKRVPENTHSDNYNSNITFLGNKCDITGPLTYVMLST